MNTIKTNLPEPDTAYFLPYPMTMDNEKLKTLIGVSAYHLSGTCAELQSDAGSLNGSFD
ncbi:MAG: hypothetical protein J1D88_09760 [Treponema sp.]|nr:hypothetical protein [Treponema sp.]